MCTGKYLFNTKTRDPLRSPTTNKKAEQSRKTLLLSLFCITSLMSLRTQIVTYLLPVGWSKHHCCWRLPQNRDLPIGSIQAPTSLLSTSKQGLNHWIDPSTNIAVVYIKTGTFLMGWSKQQHCWHLLQNKDLPIGSIQTPTLLLSTSKQGLTNWVDPNTNIAVVYFKTMTYLLGRSKHRFRWFLSLYIADCTPHHSPHSHQCVWHQTTMPQPLHFHPELLLHQVRQYSNWF